MHRNRCGCQQRKLIITFSEFFAEIEVTKINRYRPQLIVRKNLINRELEKSSNLTFLYCIVLILNVTSNFTVDKIIQSLVHQFHTS